MSDTNLRCFRPKHVVTTTHTASAAPVFDRYFILQRGKHTSIAGGDLIVKGMARYESMPMTVKGFFGDVSLHCQCIANSFGTPEAVPFAPTAISGYY